MVNYLAVNSRIILIIGQLSINDSVRFLDIPDHGKGSGLSFFINLQDPAEYTGWGGFHIFNQNWLGSMFVSYIMTNFAWGASVDPRPYYLPWSLVNPRAAQRRVRDELLCCRRLYSLRSSSNHINPIINPQFVARTTTGRVRLLNNFCSEFPLIVSVTFYFPLLV